MASLELRRVSKSFGTEADRTRVLDEVSFEARHAEFVVVLGPSGCGKSTALRLIAGLEQLDDGEILVDGTPIHGQPPGQRKVAMVFQNYALFPHLDIEQNIAFGLRVRRMPRRERRQRAREVAAQLGLTEHLAKRPAQLSGGQRQRVAVGRALVNDASLVLMDEPLSNLDAKLRAQMRAELREVQRSLGLTVVYVTHDQVEAMTMADRVVVLRDGEVEQIAPPRELYRRPETAWVAGFIGSPPMGLLPVEVVDGAVCHRGRQLARLHEIRVESAADTVTHVGIRPEHVRLAPPGGDRLEARVREVEVLGADSLVVLDIGGDRLIARVDGEVDLERDTAIGVDLAPEDVAVFGVSGERLDAPSARRRSSPTLS